MLRSVLVAGILALAISGCSAPDRVPGLAPAANVLLGDNPDTNLLASLGPTREPWPSRTFGYRFDDSTFYQTFTFDSQHWFVRNQGTTWTVGESVRSGVLLR